MTITALVNKIGERYELRPIDCAEFSKMEINNMAFEISAYEAVGLGHVSVMRAKGFFGLMKMNTLIINPTELDLPLYSYDRIYAMGNDTLIVELYDTITGEYSEEGMQAVKAKAEYKALPERNSGKHWYDGIKLASSISKKGKKKQTPTINDMAAEHFLAYLDSCSAPVTDKAAKQAKARVYVDGLLEKGGPSTDVFKKNIGVFLTKQLFEQVLFGTK